MPWQRKKQPWWLTILGLVLSVGLMFAAIPEANYVSGQLSSDTAAHLVIIALTICVLASVAYFWPGIPGWQAGAAIGFFGGFSFMVSLVEGWDSQIQALILLLKVIQIVGGVGLFVGAIWWARRLNRNVAAITRDIGEQIQTDYLFRDDGQRIVVHADKFRVLRQLTVTTVLLAVTVAGFKWAFDTSQNWILLICLALFGALFVMTEVAWAVRLVRKDPTLVIGPNGLLDNASMIAYGRGLIQWDEIVNVFVYDHKAQLGITYHYLTLLVTDMTVLRDRMPRWKRMLGAGNATNMGMVRISRSVLDRPPDALAAEIKRYVAEHAPKGWRSPLIDSVDEGEGEPTQAE